MMNRNARKKRIGWRLHRIAPRTILACWGPPSDLAAELGAESPEALFGRMQKAVEAMICSDLEDKKPSGRRAMGC
jgi:hypothetical protein